MKHEKVMIRTGVIILALVCAAYCIHFAAQSLTGKAKTKFTPNFQYGIVQTTGDKNISYITYYNSSLKKAYTQKLSYGSIGNTVEFPKVYSPKAYLVPQGVPGKKALTKVVSVNMQTGKVKSYNMKQANIISYQVDKSNIYTAAKVDGETILTKCKKNDKALSTLSLGKADLDLFRLIDDKLYAFTSQNGKDSVTIIDAESLKILDTVDVGCVKGTKKDAIFSGDTLYFLSQDASCTIGCLNLLSKEVKSIPLLITDGTQLLKYADKLFITNTGGNQVTAYDMTKQKEITHDVASGCVQATVSGSKFVLLTDTGFYIYNIKDFSVEKSIKLKAKTTKSASYHFAGFFIKP